MDLDIGEKWMIVTGASSGLGNAVAKTLAEEGARVLAVARRMHLLEELQKKYPDNIIPLQGDISSEDTIEEVVGFMNNKYLSGLFVNAGGPPAMPVREASMNDWDTAYELVFRWKVSLTSKLLPKFQEQKYGRILFSESSTVKQPLENLVLSNSMRLAVAGFAKTVSEEYAAEGITCNIIGPGFHQTDAIDRIFKKKSEVENIPVDQAKSEIMEKIKVGRIGDPNDFASLAAWLLSPKSNFVTGQVYCLDGGAIKSTL